MGPIATGNEVALAMLKAVGVDSRGVLKVQLNTERGEVASLTIVRALDAEDMARLSKQLEALERK
jgi:hypothetical protein